MGNSCATSRPRFTTLLTLSLTFNYLSLFSAATAFSSNPSSVSVPKRLQTTYTFNPSHDTYAKLSSPANNYGDSDRLRVDFQTFYSYFKFDVSGLAGPVVSAKLRLYLYDGTVAKSAGTVYPISNDYNDGSGPWEEMGLTWNNAPAITGTALDSNMVTTLNTWIEWDVTAAVTGNGTFSFGLKTSSTRNQYYHSKDTDTNPNEIPQLVIEMGPPGDPPVAVDDAATTNEDTPVAIDVAANDYDPDGSVVVSSVAIQTQPTVGTITNIDPVTGVVTYLPNANHHSSDSFTYTIDDNVGATSAPATVSITINSVNDAPVATNDTTVTMEDIAVSIDVLANDSDIDGTLNPATVTVPTPPTNGTITNIDAATGAITYTPNNGVFNITDSFTYHVQDDGGLPSNTATVVITVNEFNDPPVAGNDAVTTDEDVAVTIDVLANDNDPNGTIDPASVEVFESPDGGAITDIDPASGEVTYSPDQDFAGNDSFTYFVADDDGASSNIASVAVTVDEINDAPAVAEDNGTTDADIAIAIDVLANDSDVDGTIDASTVAIPLGGEPANGTIANIDPTTGEITYFPNNGFDGTDSFTYTVKDDLGETSAPATVTVVVNPPPPSNFTFNPSHDTYAKLSSPANNYGDSDRLRVDFQTFYSYFKFDVSGLAGPVVSAKLRLYLYDGTVAKSAGTVYPISNDYNDGSGPWEEMGLTWNNAPAITGTALDSNMVTTLNTWIEWDVTAAVTGNGTFSFGLKTSSTRNQYYHSKDTDTNPNEIPQLVIEMGPSGDPPVAVDDAATTNEDTPVAIDVAANDYDPDGSVVVSSVAIQTQPTVGTITNIDPVTGVVTYLPNANHHSSDSFTYTIDDNVGATSAPATVSITINSVNDAPVATNDTTVTMEDIAVSIDVLANDSDIDGTLNPATVTVPTPPTNGTITNIDAATGAITYTPNNGVFNITDSFTYHVQDDGGLLSNTATVMVTVNEFNDPPVAGNDAATTDEDVAVTIDVLANDNDPNGTIDPATCEIVDQPSNGTITNVDPVTGQITYTPNANYSGSDALTYTVRDNGGVISNTATVAITINAVNDAPAVADDNGTTDAGIAIAIDVLANDSDVDGTIDASTVAIPLGGEPANGTIVNIDPVTGEITYFPNNGFDGTDSFTYTVKDDLGETSAPATVTVVVNPPPPTNFTFNPSHDTYARSSRPTNNYGNSERIRLDDPAYMGYAKFNVSGLAGPVVSAKLRLYLYDGDAGAVVSAYQISNDYNDGSGPWEEMGLIWNNAPSIAGSPLDDVTFSSLNQFYEWDVTSAVTGNGTFSFGLKTSSTRAQYFYSKETTTNPNEIPQLVIEMGPSGDPPVAVDDAATTNEDTPVAIDVAANDYDPDGSVVVSSVAIQTQPTVGTITNIDPVTGVVTYLPNANQHSSDSFTYTIDDNVGATSAPATVSITINSVNDAPVATNDTTVTMEDIAVSIDVLANDSDIDGTLNPATVTVPTPPTNGTITNIDAATGAITYTPNNGVFNITDSFTYTVNDDGGATSNTATVVITVNEFNDPPVAGNDVATTDEDIAVTIDVLANDNDPNGTLDPATCEIVDQPNNGTITNVDPVTGQITYTPNANYSGSDVLTYTVRDNGGVISNIATVTITINAVNDAPAAAEDNGTTDAGIAIAIDVLANDSDVDGTVDATTVAIPLGGEPANGTIVNIDLATGEITYFPNNGFDGTDSFTYTVKDDLGETSAPATVTVVVNPPPPTNFTFNPSHDTYAKLTSPTNNYGDRERLRLDFQTFYSYLKFTITGLSGPVVSAKLRLYRYDGNVAKSAGTVYPISNDYNGGSGSWDEMVLNWNNAPAISGTALDSAMVATLITWIEWDVTPAVTGNGTFSFGLKTSSSSSQYYYSKETTTNPNEIPQLVIEMGPPGDPPVAVDDNGTTDEDTPVTINVAANDYDPDGVIVPSFVAIATPPANGSITNINPVSGEITYTPNANHNGTDTFTYTINDNVGLTSSPATVHITINSVNDAPVATNDAISVMEDLTLTVNVLANDSDVDGTINPATLTISPGTGPTNGTITNIDLTIGTVTYQPNSGYFGSDAFSYTVQDDIGATSNTATVVITVHEYNDPPVAVDDAASTNEDTGVSVDVLANDYDSNGTLIPSTVAIINQPAHGTISGIAPLTGIISYTPNANYFGNDTFTYSVQDNSDSTSNTGTVVITVNDVNDPPIAVDDAVTTGINLTFDIFVLANDSDIDGTLDAATVNIIMNASNGTINSVEPSTGVVNYTPNSGYTGTDMFTYTVQDDDGAVTNTATVSITVGALGPATFIFNAIEDTRTKASSPTNNYGSDDELRVNMGQYNSYLKFNLLGLGSPAQSATLRLYCVDAGSDGGSAYVASNNYSDDSGPWDENGVTWNNAPGTSGTLLSSVGSISNGNWYELDVTSAITGNGDFSFGLVSNTSNTAGYSSKEGVNPPQLIVTAIPVSNPPVANNDDVTTDEEAQVTIDILGNDYDSDGSLQPGTMTIISQPSNGSITNINPTTGAITYSPNTNFAGADNLTYTVRDNDDVVSNTAIVTITVNDINDSPAAQDDAAGTLIDNPVEIDVLANDSDVDGFLVTATVTVVTQPVNGTITNIDPNTGRVTYSPDLGYEGTDSFTYTIKDEDGAISNTATVTLSIWSSLGAELILSVTGDIPYSSSERNEWQAQIAAHNIHSPSEFLVHLGDIKGGNGSCSESVYSEMFEDITQLNVPGFLVPGDNEWNDCSNPTQAWNYWSQYFFDLEQNFPGAPTNMEHQSGAYENWAFAKKGVLNIGIKMVAGSTHDSGEWADMLQNAADWCQFQLVDKYSDVRTAIIYAQAGPDQKQEDFYDQLEQDAADFGKPVLLLHGNGHSWIYDYPFNDAPNLLRIQVDNGGAETPLEVTVTMDPDLPFDLKRDPLAAYLNAIPGFNPGLTVKTIGSGKVTLNPPGGLYDPGQVVWLKAEPAPGYEFRYWEGDVAGSNRTETIVMDDHKNVTATFAPIGSNEIVTHEETQTGTSFSTSTVVASGLNASENDLYLAAISSSPERDITAVSGMGLTWTPLGEQCSSDGQNEIEIWWAQGQPNGDGTVTAIFSEPADNAVIAVSRYSNVDLSNPIGSIVTANPNGTQGDCTGGVLGSNFSFDLTATEMGAIVYGAIALHNETITSGPGFTQRAQIAGGTNDTDARLVVQDRTVPNASIVSVTGEFSAQFVDWAGGGVVIRPTHAIAKPGASELELIDIPKMYTLDQNYPNPFNPSTVIKFSLPKDSEVSLKLYNINGQLIKTLAEGSFKAGRHSINFEPDQLASGIYMYELRVGKFKQSRRLIYVK